MPSMRTARLGFTTSLALLVFGAAMRPTVSGKEAASGTWGDGVDRQVAAVATSHPHQASEPPASLALLIGIDQYAQPDEGSVPPLSGAKNDTELVRDTLVRRGFRDEDIRTLVNEQATHEAIVRAIDEHLLKRAGPDTRVVVWFSGHGSFVPDRSGLESSKVEDGGDTAHDNTLLAYDSRRGDHSGRYDVTDDELFSLLEVLAKKAPHLLLVTDACHSAGMTRSARARQPGVRSVVGGSRAQDTALLQPFWPKDVPLQEDGQGTLRNLPLVHIAACADQQQAGEAMPEGGTCHGTLTLYLCLALEQATSQTSWRNVVERTRAMVTGSGNRADQLVSASGPVDRELFGGTLLPPPPGFRVDRYKHGGLVLRAGHAQGLWEDTEFRLVDAEGKTVARARAQYVDMTTSNLDLLDGGEVPWGVAVRAVIDKRPPDGGMEPLRLAVATDAGVSLPRGLVWAIATDEQAATHRIARIDGSPWLTERGGRKLAPIPNDADGMEQAFFKEWAFQRLWQSPGREGEFSMRLTVGPADEETKKAAKDKVALADVVRSSTDGSFVAARAPVLQPTSGGGCLTMTVHNDSNRTLYATVLSVTEERVIGIVWPENSSSAQTLAPGAKRSFGIVVGPSPTWPKDQVMVDRYVVIATEEPLDMQPYCTSDTPPALTRGEKASGPGFLKLQQTRGSREATRWGVGTCDVHLLPTAPAGK